MSFKERAKIKILDLYTSIYQFKKGYLPRTNSINDEIGYLLADFHNILNRWKSYFSQLFNVHDHNNVRQRDICTAKSLIPKYSSFELRKILNKLLQR
jgi:hypothetical protein